LPRAGGTSKQTSAGVDIRHLEDEDSDAPMKIATVSMDLRLAIAQARQVMKKSSARCHPGQNVAPRLKIRRDALHTFALLES
jgi:hypothetical protein